jgi:NAD(P)-dependent dehydrogenase (short-subunit alcohol dehydrogenase family)
VERIVTEVESRHGAVNLLINNAGIARSLLPPSLELKPSSDEAAPLSGPHPGIRRLQKQLAAGGPADFAEVFNVNVTSPYYVALAFLPLLEAGNRSAYAQVNGVSSQIISTASVHGRRHDRGISSVPYTITKAATEHLMQILAAMLGQWKIRSNAITPGLFPSGGYFNPYRSSREMSHPALEMTKPYLDAVPWEENIPMGRLGSNEDMAGLILFLASRAGAYVNGASHVIDGGWLDWSIASAP